MPTAAEIRSFSELARRTRKPEVLLRRAMSSDAEDCGRIFYAAFDSIAKSHGFPPDFPSPEAAMELAHALISNPSVYGVVADAGGKVIGSNFLSEGDAIRGVGPITVDPNEQGRGIGRRLMQAVLERARGAAGIRLLQDAFNMGSLALYASLGFEVREPVIVMTGAPRGSAPAHIRVRPMNPDDVDSCDLLCASAHGISRHNELRDAVERLAPMVAERGGRITAYMTAPGLWIPNHGTAETEQDMRALILGAASVTPTMSFLLPTRQTSLFGWCLSHGMQAVKPMTLMTIGTYRETDRPYMPSVFY